MPRKRQPNDVIKAFQEELRGSLKIWRDTRTAIRSETNPLAKQQSIDAFLRAGVAFENFRSDWHIAAINRNSSALKGELEDQAKKAIRGRAPALEARLSVSLPAHPTLEEIAHLLDPTGRNLSIGGYGGWSKRAERELADPWRARLLALAAADAKIMDAVVAIRNALAHESEAAIEEMNTALADFDHTVDGGLLRDSTYRVTPRGFGSYLNAYQQGGRRVELLHSRLGDIAGSLRV